MSTDLNREAAWNFEVLRNNRYPGRGIICGMDQEGKQMVQVYWIMGRSESSRNRVFVAGRNGQLRTDFADPAKGGDPSLIIYQAMGEHDNLFVVSNGKQTETVLRYSQDGRSVYEALLTERYEPDEPNYTPRITASVSLRSFTSKPVVEMFVQPKSRFDMEADMIHFRTTGLRPGFGWCVHTYLQDAPNGALLPSFRDEPYLMPLKGDGKYIMENMWDHLNQDNRVALAVKMIDIERKESRIHIVNKYERVSA